jgi:hypothetical protein
MVANTKGNVASSFEVVCRVIRIDDSLKPYVPVVGIGITLLLDSWIFPEIPRNSVKNTRVLLNRVEREALDYLVQHSGKSATEVISAALVRAKNSKVRASSCPPAQTGRTAAEREPQPSRHTHQLVIARPWRPGGYIRVSI